MRIVSNRLWSHSCYCRAKRIHKSDFLRVVSLSHISYNLPIIPGNSIPNINIGIQESSLAAGAGLSSDHCPSRRLLLRPQGLLKPDQLTTHLWSDLKTPLLYSGCFCKAGGQINVGDNNLIC